MVPGNAFEMPVLNLDNVGPKRAQVLASNGICTVYDLLGTLPSGYENHEDYTDIDKIEGGTEVCVCGYLKGKPSLYRRGRAYSIVQAVFVNETGQIRCVWHNAPYIAKKLSAEEELVLYGKAFQTERGLQLVNPSLEKKNKQIAGIIPIYAMGKKIGAKAYCKIVKAATEAFAKDLPEPIPASVREKYGLMPVSIATETVHFPPNVSDTLNAVKRFKFEEFYLLILQIEKMRSNTKKTGYVFHCSDRAFEQKLPYKLTAAQQRVMDEIRHDLEKGTVMTRLLQGDVGSGKTVVAAYSMHYAVSAGYQTAIMAPTEILAMQHYRSFCNLFPPEQVVFLSSSCTAKEKRAAKEGLKNGTFRIAVGTHALIQPDVVFENLGLVVTDEQHRFGVMQRGLLASKGTSPHVLVMTATPIPRTLSLILYNDLDVSVIDSLPPGRQKIETFCLNDAYRNRAYSFLEKRVSEGEQAYIVCPLVEESEAVNAKDVSSFAEMLQRKFPDISIGLLHGKMKDAEKDRIMQAFSAGEISVLVSTTVVEVGVDVPNATTMVIENAERFGLSQLHQLRGRVGRGTKKSYCLLFSQTRNAETLARLKVIEKSNDGFYISEQDLKQRGPGDILGIRQHGFPLLKHADPCEDIQILQQAKEAAELLIEGQLPIDAAERKDLAFVLSAMKNRCFSDEIWN